MFYSTSKATFIRGNQNLKLHKTQPFGYNLALYGIGFSTTDEIIKVISQDEFRYKITEQKSFNSTKSISLQICSLNHHSQIHSNFSCHRCLTNLNFWSLIQISFKNIHHCPKICLHLHWWIGKPASHIRDIF